MPELGSTLGTQINTPLTRVFRTIVTAGWANLSDGNVEAPTGAFSLVHIETNEINDLVAAVFDGQVSPVPYPGDYLVLEDSDGNTTVTEYITLDRAMAAYNQLVIEFTIWDWDECPECGIGGPFQNIGVHENKLKCDNGHTWDPTPEFQVLPLDPTRKVARS
jgi:hypothetical protein